ncbi:MAG: hypothetical protein EXR39_18095 [Betaproteobacteria bacterium]|nr:hypothetical protein [Betaproteobacteria bacterium]
MPDPEIPSITGLDGLLPGDPRDAARLLGVVIALAGEVFVLKAQVARLTTALKERGGIDEDALNRAESSPAFREWITAEQATFGRALLRPFTHPDEAPNVSRFLDAK